VVLFLDAAHFVWGAFLGYLWCIARVFVRSPTGRQRYNVLGALDAVSRQIHIFTNDTYITAVSVCTLLSQLSTFYGRGLPITIFLDNARYQRCELTETHARSLGIELEFLPSYSPNLNLIERYWRWVKKECLNSHYHPTFAAMKEAINQCLTNSHKTKKEQLISLLSWKFQLFSKEIVIN
jgi:transposase